MLTARGTSAVAILQVLLLTALGVLLRWGPAGWAAATTSLAVVAVATARVARSYEVVRLGPADVVTLVRATLTCSIVGLVVDQSVTSGPSASSSVALTVLGAVALALDGVDGRVARRTGTGSAFGGRIDGEGDAFLLLVLSVPVAAEFGWWVLVVGLARYVFGAAGWVLPWMRAQLPFRWWRKVATAGAGIALVTATADAIPHQLAGMALLVGFLLIAESFVRDVWWLWSHASVRRPEPAAGGPA